MENTTFTLNLSTDAVRGILAVTHAASRDYSLPLLCGVHLRRAATGGLIAEATDRFQAVRAWISGVSVPDGFDVTIDAKDFAAAVKMVGGKSVDVWLEVKQDDWKLGTFAAVDSGKIIDLAYPQIDRLFPVGGAPSVSSITMIDADLLSTIGKVRRTLGKSARRFACFAAQSDTARPLIWELSADAVDVTGLIMPVTKADASYLGWFDCDGFLKGLPGNAEIEPVKPEIEPVEAKPAPKPAKRGAGRKTAKATEQGTKPKIVPKTEPKPKTDVALTFDAIVAGLVDVFNLTPKMQERAARKYLETRDARLAVVYALGTDHGSRFDATLKALETVTAA